MSTAGKLRVRTWLRRCAGYRLGMGDATDRSATGPRLEPVRLSALMHQCPGKWVALRDGHILEVRETFDQLLFALHERGISDVTILRSPDKHEVELVGLG